MTYERTDVQFDNIPDQLKDMDRWVLWSYKARVPGSKPTKVPVQANGVGASVSEPSTWCSFEEARQAYEEDEQFAGLGFTIPEGYVGVDLDDHIRADGAFEESLKMLLSTFKTYAEVSPSKTGVKMLCHGNVSDELKKVCHQRGVEIYEGGKSPRYFAITGQVVDESHSEIRGCRNAIHSLQTMITDPIGDLSFIREDSDLASEVAMNARDEAITCLQHLPAHMIDGHDSWLRVGMALHHVDGSDRMLEHWIKWSQKSEKFEDGMCEFRWASFGKNMNINMVGLPFLKRAAAENGYDPNRWQPQDVPLFDFMSEDVSQEYIVDDILTDGECCLIGGASKTLKTSVALDLGLSIATGTPFLGRHEVLSPRNVYVISGESGKATIQKSMHSLLTSKGLTPADTVGKMHMCFNLPQLTAANDQVALVRRLDELNCNVVVIDPLYMCMQLGGEASNVYEMGQVMNPILTRFGNAGITPIILHHFRKQGKSFNEPPEMEDFSQSGIGECSRQWILLKRRGYYESDGKHDLWFVAGGSAGHAHKGVLHVDTGTKRLGLHWSPSLYTMAEWDMETQKRKMSEDMIRVKAIEHATFEILSSQMEKGWTLSGLLKEVKGLAPDTKPSRADISEAIAILEEGQQAYISTKGNVTHYYADQVTASIL